MKHTDFYTLVQDIKRKEQEELCKALEAHGGSYSWVNSEGDYITDYPIIAVNVDGICPNPTDVNIHSVYVDNGCLNFVGEDKESGEPIDFKACNVFAGHLSYIIDYIPETDTVKDVTIEPDEIPIISLDRYDLEHCGFKSEQVTSDTMRRLAGKMYDSYLDNGFYQDLRENAIDLGIPRN